MNIVEFWIIASLVRIDTNVSEENTPSAFYTVS
jgi:hypothetical protein